MKFLILNGPNLDQIGTREQSVYGNENIHDYLKRLKQDYDVEVAFESSEATLVEIILSAQDIDGIVLNAGAYTHTSLAIADAIAAIQVPVVEVHLSNIYARAFYRKTSYIAEKCKGSISGFGLDVYRLALLSLEAISNR